MRRDSREDRIEEIERLRRELELLREERFRNELDRLERSLEDELEHEERERRPSLTERIMGNPDDNPVASRKSFKDAFERMGFRFPRRRR